MIVRQATSQDASDLLALYRALEVSEGLGDLDAVIEVLKHPGTSVFVAETKAHVVAMATLHVLPNVTYSARPYALIENVVVLPEQRGHGFGRAVLLGAIEAARTRDAYKVMLLTGNARNASGFYEKLGFSPDEKRGLILRM